MGDTGKTCTAEFIMPNQQAFCLIRFAKRKNA